MMRFWKLLRGEQWHKNLLVLSPLCFVEWFLLPGLWHYFAAFFGFCFVSSMTYILNDWMDREEDRLHPTKKDRPLASGAVTGKEAIMVSAILAVMVGSVMIYLGGFYASVVGTYFVLTNLYSLGLKHVPLLDVFMIVFNFVLRMSAGMLSLSILLDSWRFVMLLFGVMLVFMSHKRGSDVKILGREKAVKHKPVLKYYTLPVVYGMRAIGFVLTGWILFNLADGVWNLSAILTFILLGVTSWIFARDPLKVMKPVLLFKNGVWVVLLIALILGLTVPDFPPRMPPL